VPLPGPLCLRRWTQTTYSCEITMPKIRTINNKWVHNDPKETIYDPIHCVLSKKPKNEPQKAVSEASQEFVLLEHCNNLQNEAVNEEALISNQEPSKRNELQLKKSPQQDKTTSGQGD
jgi:hypothetical protein